MFGVDSYELLKIANCVCWNEGSDILVVSSIKTLPKIKIPGRKQPGCRTCTSGMSCELKLFFFTIPALNFLLLWLNLSISGKAVYLLDMSLPLMYWRSRQCSRRWEFQRIPLVRITSLKLKQLLGDWWNYMLVHAGSKRVCNFWCLLLMQKSSINFHQPETRYLLLLYCY